MLFRDGYLVDAALLVSRRQDNPKARLPARHALVAFILPSRADKLRSSSAHRQYTERERIL